jgi:hypothetical protein
MQLLHGWFYVLALYRPLCLFHSTLHTPHHSGKSWLTLCKLPDQLAGAIYHISINPVTQLLNRFVATSHKFYSEFYTRNGHHVVPIHDATALYVAMLLICSFTTFLIHFNMFYAIDPSEFKSEPLVVDIETEGTITAGSMVIGPVLF